MVYGDDLLENIRLLAETLGHVEILLFHTPDLDNIPGFKEIRILKEIGEQSNLTFSVHLPASLEIASLDKEIRQRSLRLAKDICRRMSEINPLHYTLHIPYTPPTLVPVPGLYFHKGVGLAWDGWRERALDSLQLLREVVGDANRLLVENINYSPFFLEPLLARGHCRLCLDIGHLLLGQEDTIGSIKKYLDEIRTIHLHGVRGYVEHLSLTQLSECRVDEWLRCFTKAPSDRIIILEVFTPEDLEESLDMVLRESYKIDSKKER
jgi:sugar phosphate isomerase/epimerase